jgi:hypothetical protein
VEVVDCLDVETFRLPNVFEDFPISVRRPRCVISTSFFSKFGADAYEHWNKVTKKQDTFSDTV